MVESAIYEVISSDIGEEEEAVKSTFCEGFVLCTISVVVADCDCFANFANFFEA
jgi:hypothetical protein